MLESGSTSPQTFSALLILAAVFHALGLILTSFRLCFRYHIRRLWWDDFWVALTLLCDFVNTVAMWLNTSPLDDPHITFGTLPTHAQSRSTHIITFWLGLILYTCTIWFARLSIVFSVVRIIPPDRYSIRIVFGAGGVFFCMWIYLLACKVVVCSVDKAWYNTPYVQCPIPCWVALSEVCTDALSDVVLVAIPLRLLWHVKLPSNQKIMVFSVFSTSILVTVVSVVHTTYLIHYVPFIGGATAEIEGAVSLIVCNLLVIVTFLYRLITNGEDLTAGPHFKNSRSSNRLTTVDLEFSGGSQFTPVAITTGTASAGGSSRNAEATGTHVSFANTSYKDTPSRSTASAPPAVTVSTDASSPPGCSNDAH